MASASTSAARERPDSTPRIDLLDDIVASSCAGSHLRRRTQDLGRDGRGGAALASQRQCARTKKLRLTV